MSYINSAEEIKYLTYLSVTCFIANAASLLASFFFKEVVFGDIAILVAHCGKEQF